jgi:hypothetical protein
MINTARAGLLVCVLEMAAAGCGKSESPTSPTLATPSSPAASVVGEQIAGTVFDTALRPIAGALVELLDGPQAGTVAITNASGNFSLVAVVDDATRYRASRDGHVTAEARAIPDCQLCHPSRLVLFYLSLVEPPVDIAGTYALTFLAGAECTNLPEELRTRSYHVAIALDDFTWSGYPNDARTSFRVTPTGTQFPAGLNGFWLNVAGNDVTVLLGDHTDPGVAERVAADTYFAFNGRATVSLHPPVSSIDTTFEGWIDACVNPGMGSRYDCTPGPTVTRNRCTSRSHRLVLTRR